VIQLRRLFVAWSSLPADAPLADWDFVPYERNGRIDALAATKGTEIHFAVAPEQRGRLIQRARTREFLRPLFERRGYLTTRSLTSDQRSAAFLTRLGFMRTAEIHGVDHWMLTALPFTTKEN
jgi:ribosomal protein S18 acetylase RimI-like enzyme